MHADKKKKDMLIVGKGPTDELQDTTLTVEGQYFKAKDPGKNHICVWLIFQKISRLIT